MFFFRSVAGLAEQHAAAPKSQHAAAPKSTAGLARLHRPVAHHGLGAIPVTGEAGIESRYVQDVAVPLREAAQPQDSPLLVDPLVQQRDLAQFGDHFGAPGTTTLLAALEGATGKVTEACTDRHRHQEFLAFLKQVAAAYPRRQLHVVVDNLATHKHPAVRAWLARHPRVQLHLTPTSGSWLNLVEAFFSIITRQALRRGSFPTVADLIAAIERFITAWNDRCAPFTWTKDPDTVIAKATGRGRCWEASAKWRSPFHAPG